MRWSLLLLALAFCSPSRDSVLKDVERNYTATGFLDTETFQVRCPLQEQGNAAELCEAKLVDELVAYKERYDREAYQRRTHPEFLPFVTTPANAAANEAVIAERRAFYRSLAASHSRLVQERQTATGFEGTYRLRLKDLIYRVQKAE